MQWSWKSYVVGCHQPGSPGMSSACIPIPWQAAGGRTACRQAWQSSHSDGTGGRETERESWDIFQTDAKNCIQAVKWLVCYKSNFLIILSRYVFWSDIFIVCALHTCYSIFVIFRVCLGLGTKAAGHVLLKSIVWIWFWRHLIWVKMTTWLRFGGRYLHGYSNKYLDKVRD